MISDNGPQFASKEYNHLMPQCGIEHITSSPRYPQSNGLAERFVQTMKSIFCKADDANSNYLFGLQEYRNMPIPGINVSLAQLLMGRRLRCMLPTIPEQLKPACSDGSAARKSMLLKTQRSNTLYNRHAKPLKCFLPGDSVLMRDATNGTWQPAIVKEVCNEPRSYKVQTDSWWNLP